MKNSIFKGLFILVAVSLLIMPILDGSQTAEAIFILNGTGGTYVDHTATGAHDGSSWANAFTDLQTALVAASSGATIYVAQGVYKPTTGADRTATFQLKSGVTLLGGYPTGGIGSRDPKINVTTLSGDLLGNDNSNIAYDEATRSENACHVVTGSGTNSTAKLDGFTISGGNANDYYALGNSGSFGAGMYTNAGSPTVQNVTFINNSAMNYGAGMYNTNGSSVSIIDVTFTRNRADSGGGMYNSASSPTVRNAIFNNNAIPNQGAGMYNAAGSSPILTNVTFSGNSGGYGGAIFNNGLSSNPTLMNVTFSGNSADFGAAIYNFNNSAPVLTNCILWGDSPDEINYSDTNAAVVTYSVVQGGCIGTGNLSADPNLGPLGNYGGYAQTFPLLPGSSAINSATATGAPSTDQRGVARPQPLGGAFDIGAFEVDSTTAPQATVTSIAAASAYPLAPLNVTVYGTNFSGPPTVLLQKSGLANIVATNVVLANSGQLTCTLDITGAAALTWNVVVLNPDGRSSALPNGFTVLDITHGNVYVDKNSSGGVHDGTSWATAFTDLVGILAVSRSGDTLHVAQGSYKPTTGADRTKTFQLKTGVSLLGGYPTGGPDGARDSAVYITTLSGDIGAPGNTSDNSYHVVTGSGTDSTAIIDGFTVTGGNANANEGLFSGGGMYNSNGSPTVQNVIFSGNSAFSGGGMCNSDASPELTNVTFSNNSAGSGGGMYNSSGAQTLTNVTFSGNVASYGGGMYNDSGTQTLTNVTFSGNTSGGSGGGIYKNRENQTLTNVTFTGNSASDYGGGIYTLDDKPSDSTLTNVTFSNNSASIGGGGIYLNKDCSLITRNCILWADSPNEIYNGGTATVTYSVVQGGFSGAGNLSADPKLGTLGSNGGYTHTMPLLPGSAAIDAGDNDTCAATDQRGIARPQGAACDIGAFESRGFTLATTGGDGQSAAMNTAFAQPLELTVSETGGSLLPGALVTFTAPASGASLTQTTFTATADSQGIASATVTANGVAGAYTVTAGTAGAASVDFNLTNGASTTTTTTSVPTTTTSEPTTTTTEEPTTTTTTTTLGCASSITVANNYDSGAGSLRQAIADACADGTITFGAGLARQTITLSSTLTIGKNLTIDGGADNITVSGNNAVRVFYVNSGVTFNLQNLTVAGGNTGSGVGAYGGGIYNSGGSVNVTGVTFSGNSAVVGGGIFNDPGMGMASTVADCTFSGNSAGDGGGGIYTRDTLTVTGSTISGNSAGSLGGGIANIGMLTVTGSTISGNSAGMGGGIYSRGTLTVTGSTFSGNSGGDGGGGGIYNTGPVLTVTGSTFSGNSTSNTGGGGIYLDSASGLVTVTGSTFSGNNVGYTASGGGIKNMGAVLTVTNSTFSGNYGEYGGAIYTYMGRVTLTNSTLSGNGALRYGGSIYNHEYGTLNYANTIIANSTSAADCANGGTIGTNVNNLVEDGSCAAALSGDPLLGPIVNNGGPTQTMALLAGSPAINAGDATRCDDVATVNKLDQRGVARPQGTACDIGAFELVDITPPDTSIDSNPANPTSSTSASFTFSGTDNDSGVASFECDLDGGGFSVCTSPKNYTSLADGSHTFRVRAIDFFGNVDATPASYTWVVDTTAPDTSITANPANPSSSTSASFTFSGTDNDSGVASFECDLDGGGFSACTSPKNYTSLADGSHTFRVRAIDNVGLTDGSPASFTWSVDTAAPSVVVSSVTASPTNTSPITVTITFNEAVTGFTPSVAAGDIVIGGVGGADSNPGVVSGTTYTFDLVPSGQGAVTVQVPAGSAFDAATNANTVSNTFSITYDTAAPTVDTFTATSPCSNVNIPITAFTASDTVAVTWYMITESATQPSAGDTGWSGTAPAAYTVAGTGSYTLYPWAKDGVGNVSAVYGSPAAVTVCYASITVTSNADSGAGSLRQAIADVCDDGTINFADNFTIMLASQLTIDKNLTIDGSGHSVTVDGDNATRVFSVESGFTFNLKNMTVANGNAGSSNSGGGIDNDGGSVNITGVTFSGNSADSGGGIFNNSGSGMSSTVAGCTFSGNSAGSAGGGIYTRGALTITNCTFSGNSATSFGGGMYNRGTVTLTNNTFLGNSAGNGGGMYTISAVTINNSIIAASVSGENCGGSGTVSGASNLADDDSCGSGFANSSTILLGPLGDYGGPTQTLPLLPGSSAIDAGDVDNCSVADQRGKDRVGACDIGAFESQGFTLTVYGGNNQSAEVNTAFAAPLSVTVTADNASEPVDGGQVTFTAHASGASAAITGSPATISSGAASVTATANDAEGSYTVTAGAAGSNQLSFNLENTAAPVTTTTTTAPETTTTTTTIPVRDGCLTVVPAKVTKLLWGDSAAEKELQTQNGVKPLDSEDIIALIRIAGYAIPLQSFIMIGNSDTVFTRQDRPEWNTDEIHTLLKLKLKKRIMFALVFINPFTAEAGTYTVTAGDCAGTMELLGP